jgi:hypothetical protein
MGQGSDHVPPFRLSVGLGEQERFANNQVEDIRRGPAESSPETLARRTHSLVVTRARVLTEIGSAGIGDEESAIRIGERGLLPSPILIALSHFAVPRGAATELRMNRAGSANIGSHASGYRRSVNPGVRTERGDRVSGSVKRIRVSVGTKCTTKCGD